MKTAATKRYKRSFRKLTKNDKQLGEKVIKTLQLFRKSPNHPSLRLHKLSNSEVWSISVNMQIRIIFIYKDKKAILLDIGDHGIYE